MRDIPLARRIYLAQLLLYSIIKPHDEVSVIQNATGRPLQFSGIKVTADSNLYRVDIDFAFVGEMHKNILRLDGFRSALLAPEDQPNPPADVQTHAG